MGERMPPAVHIHYFLVVAYRSFPRSDTKVYIIGGATAEVIVPINNITVYDTVAGTWFDGKSIIIFGGTGGSAASYFSDVWTLDVNLFQWTSPAITGSGSKSGIYGMNCRNLLTTFAILCKFSRITFDNLEHAIEFFFFFFFLALLIG
ncbi:hypothetical protein BC936DRAFT_145499 [Jimgerdemannia flammicorona]|uniref:Galactose oxidase n=1 Tax=Jimgerdemannia flammicorona TaxID=994334 RepID=A0A433DLR4_9FUNG|nr:hypothetical protein BC936DRAFT_145499 [Jimgerdemannia flammicorona]